ncbi:hypothetical protein [Phormidium sp. CCY1219]|uniref:hypothetical protein n=1 Tax=Phormidium sp. CCY1219 TaxID=2886104 RepID=UPI002D1F0014|nr:hypothetical protein [Phormidium sp. CCY1219]MEB3828668.1 hypothetical protein [Phormidium sp. CCY1219]
MSKKNGDREPLRKFITPAQFGLLAFVILFWVITIYYAVEALLQENVYCIQQTETGQNIGYGEECKESE